MVQWEDGGPWIEGNGDQNHHDRSYHICITKTGQLVTQTRQHVNPTQISAKQYLWDQLQKYTKTDQLEDILTQPEKQTTTSNNDNNNINNGPFINNATHEHSTLCKELDINHRKSEENNEHKISKEGVSVNLHVDHKGEDHDSFVRTRYGRTDRLAY